MKIITFLLGAGIERKRINGTHTRSPDHLHRCTRACAREILGGVPEKKKKETTSDNKFLQSWQRVGANEEIPRLITRIGVRRKRKRKNSSLRSRVQLANTSRAEDNCLENVFRTGKTCAVNPRIRSPKMPVRINCEKENDTERGRPSNAGT